MSSGGGSPDIETTTSTMEPPAWMRPYIVNALEAGQSLYNTRSLTPPGPLFNQDQLAGFESIRGAAQNPLLTQPSIDYAQNVIGGDYLSPDRIREAAEPAIGQALQSIRGGFEGAGGTGGSMEAIATGEGVTRALAPYYEAERQRQQQAAFAAPSLEQTRYAPGQALLGIGGQQRGAKERAYMEPWERYRQYIGTALGGSPAALAGGTQTQQTPYYSPSPFQQVLGAGMSIAPFFL